MLQFGRFGLVGVLATAIHSAVVIVLVEGSIASPLLANVLGYGVGFSVSYLGGVRWVFRGTRASGATLLKFSLVAALGLLLNQAINYFVIYIVSWHYLIGLGAALAIVPAITFALQRVWVFRRPPEKPRATGIDPVAASRSAIALLALLGSGLLGSPP